MHNWLIKIKPIKGNKHCSASSVGIFNIFSRPPLKVIEFLHQKTTRAPHFLTAFVFCPQTYTTMMIFHHSPPLPKICKKSSKLNFK